MPSLTRRRLLAATGGGVALAAGCLGGTDGAPTLGEVKLLNNHGADHTIDVQVEHDDEVVYWATHQLPKADADGGSAVTLAGDWTDQRGSYLVRARLDDRTEWRSEPLEGGAGCYQLLVQVAGDGTFDVWQSRVGDDCGESDGGA